LLRAYSTKDFRETWSILVPEVDLFPGKVIRAGADRFAFIAFCTRPGYICPGSELGLIDLKALPRESRSDLQITSSTPRTNLLVSARFKVTFAVMNLGPWTLDQAQFVMGVPSGLRFESGTSSAGVLIASNNVVTAQTGTLINSATAVFEMTFTVLTE